MIFSSTSIDDCKKIDLEKYEDSRGFFARAWCSEEFENARLPGNVVQSSLSFNRKAGTLRGMHLQLPPSKEGKVVRCIRGAIFDAVVDLRSYAGSYLQSVSIRLDEDNRTALFIPPGCAHGFQTLDDETEVLYMMTDAYRPDLSTGFRWDDPAFDIDWPIDNPTVLARDADYADFDSAAFRQLEW